MSQYMRNADFYNVPDDAANLTRKRSGTYRAYYSADGTLMHAYSYNTCIFTRLPNGRAVYNGTRYSTTTSKHQCTVRCSPDYNYATACDVIDAPVGTTASGLCYLVTQYMSYPEAYNAR